MGENFKLMRFYLVLLALFTVGRWALSLGGAEYAKTHQIFSLVILTNISALYYGFVSRTFLGAGVKRAVLLGVSLAAVSQLVIVVSMLVSYGLGMETFFNHPTALNVDQAMPFGQAVGTRAVGFVINVIVNGVFGALGWLIAMVVPKQT
jgi:hypothetical protein